MLIRAENVVVGSARSDLDPELEPGRYVRVVVEDDGVGMEPRVRDRVFDPFFTTHALGEGTGLGLASVYGFCRRVGGAVTVESAAGCGSKFSLYLPAGDSSGESAKMATTDEDVDRPVGEGITVLVVEDEDEVRDVTALALRSKGFRVLEARDGVEAIQTISSSLHPVAIVLTDVIMPRMSGTKLAARIRELHPELPVIFMSGYVDDPRLSEDPTLTLAGILRKPFSVAELVDAVSQALPVDPRLVADSSSTGP